MKTTTKLLIFLWGTFLFLTFPPTFYAAMVILPLGSGVWIFVRWVSCLAAIVLSFISLWPKVPYYLKKMKAEAEQPPK